MMMKFYLRAFLLLSIFTLSTSFIAIAQTQSAQEAAMLIRNGAVKVADAENLSDSVYTLLSKYDVIMVGEMHGTVKPARLVTGLAKLFAAKGDSVLVGMEIPAEQMEIFNASGKDSSIYQSKFFADPYFKDGRSSFAWANVIAKLNNNPRIRIFFFDINKGIDEQYSRDSIMASKIKQQMLLHPTWKVVTLCGNAHVRNEPDKMISYLRRDKELNEVPKKICSLNNHYLKGTCFANFSHGMELRTFGKTESVFDTTIHSDYIYLVSAKSDYPYTGFFYTRYLTPSKMVYAYKEPIDTAAINRKLNDIYERDQKVRKGDSAQYMQYIDSINLRYVEELIAKYGWPDKKYFGAKSNFICYLVIQHADSATQEKYLPMLMQSVEDGESRKVDLAYLYDRVLMRENKKQLYGTQVIFNKTTGAQEFYPIEDEANVNIRRKEIGLQPMEEYGSYFGINYKLPR